MRIGIDASRAFQDQMTGTENYSYQMLKHLLGLQEAEKHEWVLYVKSDIYDKFPSNVKIKKIALPYLWTQFGLAGRTWIDNLDVLWIPAHTLPVLRRPGIKSVVTIHGIEYEYLPSFQNPLQRWYLPLSTQYATNFANEVIAVSQFTKSQLIERLHADDKKITVIHEGVDISAQKSKLKNKNILNKFGLVPKKYFVFIGTVQPRKNLNRLIKAFLDIQNKQFDLVVIGKLGWGNDDLPKENHPNIKFLGYLDESHKNEILTNAYAYVQPSITEGFGLPILEAFAANVPVISSNGGALSEVVGEAGLLFDPFNIVEIKEKLEKIIVDPTLTTKLTKLGAQRLSQFSWEKAARQTYNILTRG